MITSHCGHNNEVFISGRTQKLPASSSEAIAIREASVLARLCSIDAVIVESDCLQIIEACRGDILFGASVFPYPFLEIVVGDGERI